MTAGWFLIAAAVLAWAVTFIAEVRLIARG